MINVFPNIRETMAGNWENVKKLLNVRTKLILITSGAREVSTVCFFIMLRYKRIFTHGAKGMT